MPPDYPDRQTRIYRATITGSVINLLLLAFKFAAGIIGHSSAMIADAFHSLSDLASDAVVFFFLRFASRGSDSNHEYGHGKFETLAAIIIAFMLLAVGAGILVDSARSIMNFYHGEKLAIPNLWALSAAIFSIILKEWLYRYTMKVAKKTDSSALAANAWHHRSDAITSLAALAGIAGAMLPGQGWAILDPLAALIVSFFIIWTSLALLKPALDELLEKSLPEAEKEKIAEIISGTPGVISFHRLATRRIGPKRAIEVHVKMESTLALRDAHDIATRIEIALKKEFGSDTHVGVHMEPELEIEQNGR